MRRSDKEIIDKRTFEEILSKAEICRIGIIDDGIPYIVPLNYGYCGGKLYFHSARQGRKMELLRKNNRVSFEIEYLSEIIKGDIPCNWTTRYRSLMGTGYIEISENETEIREGLDIIMAHYGDHQSTYDESFLKRIVILTLTIEKISGKQSGEWNA
jgi:nitroimidazol reductase NimA-like FMN-containing flavoprotein (pyridoxamine 5'-phosphate oxidase superfamily)